MTNALKLMACAAVLWLGCWSSGEAAGIRPGWYAYSLLVYGNNGYERNAAGCLRWHFQQRAWWDHCAASRQAAVVAKN